MRCLISALCHVTAREVSKNIELEKRAQSGMIFPSLFGNASPR